MSRTVFNLTKTFNLIPTRTFTSHSLNNKPSPFSYFNKAKLEISVRHARTDSNKCWKCGIDKKLLTELFCEKCSVVQGPFDRDNYFRILDVNESFTLDTNQLKTKYRQLQTLLHPDKFSNRTEKEKSISADYSALVNKAYNSLQAPLSRAIHLLKLKNVAIDEDQKISDPEFLTEIMELNEEVEEADSADKIRELDEKNRKTLGECERGILEQFNKGDIEEVKKAVIRMKYYVSLSGRISSLMREKGIVS